MKPIKDASTDLDGVAWAGGQVVGIGVGASVIDKWGYSGAYWIAAVSALVSAGIAVFLRQPGRSVPAVAPSPATVERSMAATLVD